MRKARCLRGFEAAGDAKAPAKAKVSHAPGGPGTKSNRVGPFGPGWIETADRNSILEALEESRTQLGDAESRFQILAQAIPVICWSADASGWIDWYNERWYEYTGQTADEAAGWGWQAAHHPDDFLEVMRRWPHSIATGVPFEMEFRLRRYDGVYHWFLTRAEPLRDERGVVVRWYGSNVDVDAQKRAHEQTKRVAERLQEVFLPAQLPNRPDVHFDAVYLPAESESLVGGDWYDVFDLPSGGIGFSIGDVAGHGLAASMLVGRLRQAIYTLALLFDDPARVLNETNRVLQQQDPGTMVTALMGFIDPARSQISYANAGHPPMLLARSAHEPATVLATGDLPLGVVDDLTVVTHSVSIPPTAVVAIYTDGMVEFARDLMTAESRLQTAIALLVGDTTLSHPATTIKEIVFENNVPRDDAALLLMQFSRERAQIVPSPVAPLERTWRFHSSHAFTASKIRTQIVEYFRESALDPRELDDAEIVVGEIVANAVYYAQGLIELSIDWGEEKPVLKVVDVGSGIQSADFRLPNNPMQESGRGLFLVRSFADEVRVEKLPDGGSCLCVVLPVRRRVREPYAGSPA